MITVRQPSLENDPLYCKCCSDVNTVELVIETPLGSACLCLECFKELHSVMSHAVPRNSWSDFATASRI